ncbi:tetratricopeptide repeat protein [Gimesia sp.]|uniref:tetratricopeptide repeat protein n=1 Tax=Gimesia sp. TaxID=2024833 RepID=UPI003A909D5A
MNQLKDEIRKKHQEGKLQYTPHENFRNASDLSDLVLSDFEKLINTLYPEEEKPSSLERERLDHAAFADSRTSVYIRRQDYFDQLDTHVAGDGPPMVVLGESGSGKSALLANWATTYCKQHPDEFVLLHFIGGSPNSASITGLLQRIMLELKEKFQLADEVPANLDQMIAAFPTWLTKAAEHGRIVLVIDALNQLENFNDAPGLSWFPYLLPKSCRVIFSTLAGRSLEAAKNRGWMKRISPLYVEPLNNVDRVRLTWKLLRSYRKQLSKPVRRKIALAVQSQNPLFLRVLLDELRVFGVYETLNERIDWYLEAKHPGELFEKVICRWEESFEDEANETLVGDVLSLLWASRYGISESELLDLLSESEDPFPSALFSPLFLAMSESLVSRKGLLSFAHDYLRDATETSYLPNIENQQLARKKLAQYFQREEIWSDRNFAELPWLLAEARDWKELHTILTDQSYFLALNNRDEYELRRYWQLLPDEYEMGSSYSAAFEQWVRARGDTPVVAHLANILALFLYDFSCFSEAEPLIRRALEIDEAAYGPEHPEVATDLNNLAQLLKATNRLTEAEPLMRRALEIDEAAYGPEHPKVARDLNNLAILLMATNRLTEAEPLMRRVVTIFEAAFGENHPKVATALNNLAQLLQDTNRLTEAEPLMRRGLEIDEAAYGPEHPTVAIWLNNLAQLLMATNRLTEAEPLMRRTLEIFTDFYRYTGKEHVHFQTVVNNYVEFLIEMGLNEQDIVQRLTGLVPNLE